MIKIFTVIIFFASPLLCGVFDVQISPLPAKKIIPVLTASGAEHRISYTKFLTEGSFIGSMGGSFPLADVQYQSLLCQISAASSVYTTLKNAGVKFNVTNADFYVDVYFDFPIYEETAFRFGWGHTSHHLVDDAVQPGISAINYARDFYNFFAVQKISAISGMAYGGITWTYSFLINKNIGKKIMPQFGAESSLYSFSNTSLLYAALDVRYRGELHYASTQSYQAGIKFVSKTMRAFRFAYTYRTGADERGQFYNKKIQFHTVGMFFDF